MTIMRSQGRKKLGQCRMKRGARPRWSGKHERPAVLALNRVKG
jgi:hypothetical protein